MATDDLAAVESAGSAAAVLEQLMRSRFSCRGYRPDPVPHETIEKMLSIAQLSAS